ncbi:site-specific recombinase XerD [Paenibacillus taihuensis]|uniref:Site-specific recombinase XerD n=1 Tax=Paenibacillus taihuensis TaxID=1156355 RepID=A0A3D9RU10_9BACL|nr:tyrosine-type recombinase/integrase [Paenibacillus taihuensis]REE81231.1 site-specific recombinase XerD [Paenibacillus taihuensis]
MRSLKAERTLREDGIYSYVVIDDDYNIIEEITCFLDYLETKGRSENTIETYSHCLAKYFEWLNSENLKFYEVNKRKMISWVKYLKSDDKNMAAVTVNKHLAAVGSFYNYYEGIGGFISENPLKTKVERESNYFTHTVLRKELDIGFFRQKVTKKTNNLRLFPNQVETLYNTIDELEMSDDLKMRGKLLFRILYETGCRIGEVLGLRLMDYTEPDLGSKIGCIKVQKRDPLYHKDHKIKTLEREIPVSMDLIFAIDEYVCFSRPESPFETIFVQHSSSDNGKFLTRNTPSELFEQLSLRSNIKCTPHKLRHTHGTELTELGYNSVYVQHRLGHSSILSTSKYQHPSYESQREAYERVMARNKMAVLK